jgi:hypothetical protein
VEALEDRRPLDAGGQAIVLFETSLALFVENQGQWDDDSVRFLFQGSGANVLHTDGGPVFQVFQSVEVETTEEEDPVRQLNPLVEPDDVVTRMAEFSVSFDGASPVEPVGQDRAEAVHNYFVGEEANWRSGVPTYETVAYPGLYDGIDLLTWGRRDSLKYEFHVAPGANYEEIQVSYEGIEGLWLDDDGALHVETALGELVDDVPYIYQQIDGQEVEVAGRFELIDGDTYAFAITGAYDPATELVIDPDLSWASYLSDSDGDQGYGIAVDAWGNAFVTGITYPSDFPTSGGFDTTLSGSSDAFVAKISGGGQLLWASYLGGSDFDYGYGIAVDAWGNAFVTG